MPFRAEFFKNLLIRISGRISLNDPFEFLPSASYISQLFMQTKYFRLGESPAEIESFFGNMDSIRDWKFIEGPIGDFGVISFTSSPRNIIMWSHYANSHRGIVVGFDSDSSFFTEKFLHDGDPVAGKVHRVKYSKKRVNRFESFHAPLLTKSSAWKYESEFRLVANLFHCDKKLLRNEDFDRLSKSGLISGLSVQPHSDALLEVIGADFPGSLIRFPEMMFMAKIPATAIRYIGIGSRMPESDQNSLLSYVESTSEFDSVKIEKFCVDKYDFKLNRTSVRSPRKQPVCDDEADNQANSGRHNS